MAGGGYAAMQAGGDNDLPEPPDPPSGMFIGGRWTMKRLIFYTAIISLCFAQQTYDSEIQPIWDANCTRCHGSSGNLDLSQGVSYSNIVNVASSGYSGFLLVEPNDPMNSVMHQKIVGNSAFGERMPKNASKLSTSDENKIKTWIDNGALKDWSGGGSGTPNTLEIVVRLNQNIGNGDVHVGVWLPGNAGNPEITDNKDNLTAHLHQQKDGGLNLPIHV